MGRHLRPSTPLRPQCPHGSRWMAGKGKRVIVYIPEMVEPELMYKLFDQLVGSLEELIAHL